MPFTTLINNLSSQQAQGSWQLRISIDPSLLQKDSESLNTIKRILKEQLVLSKVNVKIWEVTDEADYLNDYDGTTSSKGKDRTERGKEICIFLPDTLSCDTDPKKILLDLWQAFQKNKIPLVCMSIPGDQKILGPDDLPTPFSFTSVHPPHMEREWTGPHGILHKQFIPYENNHPLLGIHFTTQELESHEIIFNPDENLINSRRNFYNRQSQSKTHLEEDLQSSGAKGNYGDLLLNDEIISRIKTKLQNYINEMPATIDERPAYKQKFNNSLMEDSQFQQLLNRYPLQVGSHLEKHPAITQLTTYLHLLEVHQVDNCIQTLRTNYAQNGPRIIQDIKANFTAHTNNNGTTPETMPIDWTAYIPDYSPEHLEELIRHNPAGMQKMYRRIVLLEQDRQGQHRLEHQFNKAKHKTLYAPLNEATTVVLDIDHTLIMGQDIYENTVFNTNLINALVQKGIHEIYLCTDMSYDRQSILERMALIDVLKENGIHVLGISTPQDYFWEATEDQLKQYDPATITFSGVESKSEAKSVRLDETITCSKNKVGHAFDEARELYSKDYKAYKKYREDKELKGDLICSVPNYLVTENKINAPAEEKQLEEKANKRKILAEECSKQENLAHSKGLLFKALMNQTEGKSFLFFDDNTDAISAVESCRMQFLQTKKISTKLVNKNNKDSQLDYETVIDYHKCYGNFAKSIDSFVERWCPENSTFKNDLMCLHNDLAKDLIEQYRQGKSKDKLVQSAAFKIVLETVHMLHNLNEVLSHPIASNNWKSSKIPQIMQNYEKKCTQIPDSKKFLKILAVVVTTILGFFLGFLVGAGIGITAGAWTGVGAAATATVGAFKGAADGAAAGLAIGTALTSLSIGGLTAYGLFRTTPLMKTILQDVNTLTRSAESLYQTQNNRVFP